MIKHTRSAPADFSLNNTCPGNYIHSPIEIRIFCHDESPELICGEILVLTKNINVLIYPIHACSFVVYFIIINTNFEIECPMDLTRILWLVLMETLPERITIRRRLIFVIHYRRVRFCLQKQSFDISICIYQRQFIAQEFIVQGFCKIAKKIVKANGTRMPAKTLKY